MWLFISSRQKADVRLIFWFFIIWLSRKKGHLKGMNKYKQIYVTFLSPAKLPSVVTLQRLATQPLSFSALAYTTSVAVTGLGANQNGKTSVP